jgi:hypothetical protein
MNQYQRIIWNIKYFFLDICCYLISLLFSIVGKKKKLAVIYLYADKKKYPDAYNNLKILLKGLLSFEITIIKVDNFNEKKNNTKEGDNVYDIGGDNTYWEFSGWQKGLDFLAELAICPDLVLFINDAFLNYEEKGENLQYYKSRINILTLSRVNHSAFGVIDHHKDEVFLGYDVSSWIRSNLFMMPYDVAMQIKFPPVAPEIIQEITPDKYNGKLFLENDHINSTFKEFLEYWMTKGWRYSDNLNMQNYSFLRSKLISILNERFLTAKLREMKVPIMNMDDIWDKLK